MALKRCMHFLVPVLALLPMPLQGAPFVRGDSNGDGIIDIGDAVFTLQFLFTGETDPECLDACDFNDDTHLDITDPVAELAYLFLDAKQPPGPFPYCGEDPSTPLGCQDSPCATDRDFLHFVETEANFFALSVPSSTGDDRQVKYFVPAREDPALLPSLYQNTKLHIWHHGFLVSVFPERFPSLGVEEYLALVMLRDTRDYFAGSIYRFLDPVEGFVYGFAVLVDQSSSDELLSAEETRQVYDTLAASFQLRPLVYAPVSALEVLAARSWKDPGFPIYFK